MSILMIKTVLFIEIIAKYLQIRIQFIMSFMYSQFLINVDINSQKKVSNYIAK